MGGDSCVKIWSTIHTRFFKKQPCTKGTHICTRFIINKLCTVVLLHKWFFSKNCVRSCSVFKHYFLVEALYDSFVPLHTDLSQSPSLCHYIFSSFQFAKHISIYTMDPYLCFQRTVRHDLFMEMCLDTNIGPSKTSDFQTKKK